MNLHQVRENLPPSQLDGASPASSDKEPLNSANGAHAESTLAERLARLSPEQRALLRQKLSAKSGAAKSIRAERNGEVPTALTPIRRSAPGGMRPLSFTQELVWLHEQLLESSVAYHVPRALRIRGPLNVAALEQALLAIITRHEILRTCFRMMDGNPVQIIGEAGNFRVPVIDLSCLPGTEREAEAMRRVMAEVQTPFDLTKDLLMRAILLRLDEEDFILTLVTHHIASDGGTKMIFYRELSLLYQAISTGTSCQLPELPIQYADYACWQRQHFQGETLDQLLSYWKRQLEGAPPVLDVPADRPRPAVLSFRGTRELQYVEPALAQGLKALSREEGTTLFMTALAIFNVLMHRYTGATDIIVGTPISIRNRTELEGLIGFFVNTLVLRTDVSDNPTVRQLLGRVRRMTLDAYDHQDLPFEVLMRELHPDRDPSRTPVIQVMFSVGKHDPMLTPEFPGITMEPVRIDRGFTKFDLVMGLTDGPDWMMQGAEYSTDLFDAQTIRQMLGHYQELIRSAINNPDERVGFLPLLSSSERENLLVAWNATDLILPAVKCIHELFEVQATRKPTAIAAIHQKRSLSYRELDSRANQLARYLQKLGVGPDIQVGVALESSLDVAIALLGILKAGGAYLPLDPAYPSERLAWMLEDSRVPIVLSQEPVAVTLPRHAANIICLDTAWERIGQESTEAVTNSAKPDHLAYTIYTSGSTGRPKAVLVTHRSVVNHSAASVRHYGLVQDDRVLQFASLSFDIAVEEMFPAWSCGAAVVFRPPDLPLSAESFSRWVEQEGITVLDLPTAFWHGWVHELARQGKSLPAGLRITIVGGEKAASDAYREWLNVGGRALRWVNTYGPTESTVVATTHEPVPLSPDLDPINDIPIGRPIDNVQVYVLDRYLQPVPVGVAGELYIGGAGLARGYGRAPDLTAERFIPNPFSAAPGARLYKTGDLVRYLKNGQLQFVARIDQQAKIRGFRIEPGEIEALLRQHPGVQEATVIVADDLHVGKRLVAYVATSNTSLEKSSLREFLEARLPAYMVPSAIVVLDALPRTPTGKIDYRALPAPEPTGSTSELDSAPRDATEAQLAMLWEEVLGQPRIGVQDSFFDLGGHSLLAARLFARIETVFGRTLPLRALFQAPTLEGLASILREAGAESTFPTLVPVRSGGSGRPLFCIVRPNANPLGYAFLARHLGPDQPVYVLQCPLQPGLFQEYRDSDFATLAAEYVRTIRTVQPDGPYLLVGYCEGAHVAVHMARQLEEGGHKVGLLAILDAWPVANSRSYVRWHLWVAHGTFMQFLAAPFREKLRMADRFFHMLSQRVRSYFPVKSRKAKPRTTDQPASTNWLTAIRKIYWPGKTYVPPIVNAKITLFRVRKQECFRIRDKKMGWGGWTRAGVEVHRIQGEHRLFLREPHVQMLARKLSGCIQRANQDLPGSSDT